MKKSFKDLFHRRTQDEFTFYNKEERKVTWDDGFDNYSDFLTSKSHISDREDVISIASSMLSVMKSENKNLIKASSIKPGVSSDIQIPTKLLKDPVTGTIGHNTTGNQKDIFYGQLIHNASAKTLQKQADYRRYLKDKKASRSGDLRSMISTLIKDESLNKKVAKKFPGYSKFLQKSKKGQYLREEGSFTPTNEKEDVLDFVTRLIRFPQDITEEAHEKYNTLTKEVTDIFRATRGIPNDSDTCEEVADILTKKVLKYIVEPPEEEKDKKESPGECDDPDDASAGDLADGDSSKSDSDKNDEEEKEMTLEDLKEELTPEEEAELIDMRDAVRDIADSLEDVSEEDNYADDKFVDDLKGKIESDKKSKKKSQKEEMASQNIRVHNQLVNCTAQNKYDETAQRLNMVKANVLRNMLSRKHKDHSFNMNSMRSGRLDTNKLAEAAQNVPTIYTRIGKVLTNKLTVGVLIDESGSMGGVRIQKAREAAIFINEAFGKLQDVSLFIYGHSADLTGRSTDVFIYREPGTNIEPKALGNVQARRNNRDGVAIKHVAQRIRNHTEDHGILFVISDGQPAANGYGGFEHTRKSVIEAENLGFQVIQVAICSGVASEKMFTHYIKMTDIKTFPNDLVKYVTKKVDKILKTKYVI